MISLPSDQTTTRFHYVQNSLFFQFNIVIQNPCTLLEQILVHLHRRYLIIIFVHDILNPLPGHMEISGQELGQIILQASKC